jgi:hypothetical protein
MPRDPTRYGSQILIFLGRFSAFFIPLMTFIVLSLKRFHRLVALRKLCSGSPATLL